MSFITILLFFVYTWGLGFSLTKWIKNSENFLERNIMRIGIGLAAFVLLGVLFNLFKIPIDWKWFLLASIIIPLLSLILFIKKLIKKEQTLTFPKPQLTKSNLYIILVLIIFSLTLFMYTKGAFSYPYLEDDDPWGHAEGTKYVAVEKTIETDVESLEERFKGVRFFGYLDPYPPGYDMLLGVLHQTAPSLNWTLKFFNALFISLGIVFFYFFVKHLTNNSKKALFSTFVLAAIPAYFTHFIWAHSLVVPVFFVVMYCLEQFKEDKKWAYAAAVVFAAMLLIQPSKIFKLVPMVALYLIIKWLLERKFPTYQVLSIISGIILSLAWWFEKAKNMLTIKVAARIEGTAAEVAQSTGILDLIKTTLGRLPEIFPPEGGSATRAYNFNDFFYAQSQGLINTSVGIGIFVYLLLFITTVFLLWYFYKHTKLKQNELSKPWLYVIHALISLNAVVAFILAIRYLTLIFGSFSFLLSLKLELIQFILLFSLSLIVYFKNIPPQETGWHAIALSWLVFTFLFVNSETFNLPIGLWAFRIWTLFAIAAAILVSEGLWFLLEKNDKVYTWIILGVILAIAEKEAIANGFLTPKSLTLALLIVVVLINLVTHALKISIKNEEYNKIVGTISILVTIIIGITATSAYQKYSINTSLWGAGGSWQGGSDEIDAYNWLKTNLPANTKVFPYSGRDQNMMGFDMFSCKWCPEVNEYRKTTLDHNAEELHKFLKSQGYEYIIIDAMSYKYVKRYGGYNDTVIQEQLPKRFDEIAKAPNLFKPVYQTRAAAIFKIT